MTKQNLVFIMTDQQRADTIGMVVGGKEVTPNLNKLGKQSTVFHKAYDACPLCVPARTALATGINPLANGMMLNDLPGKYAKNHQTIHQMLFDAGYDVAHIGVHHISTKPNLRETIPFAKWICDDDYEAYAHQKGLEIARSDSNSVVIDEFADGEYRKHRYSNARVSAWKYALEDFKDVWFADNAVDFINREHHRPFALFLYMWAPHPPLIVPKEYKDKFPADAIELPANTNKTADREPANRRRGAAAQLGQYPSEGGWEEGWSAHLGLTNLCDSQVGKLLAALDENGLSENTAVVFTTDHGEQLGQHSMYQKMEMYEPAVRVPAIFHIPASRHYEYDTAISHLDFVPTILDLLGIPQRHSFEGISLRKSITEGQIPPERDIFSVYCGNHQFGDMRRMIVSKGYKYIYDGIEGELYHLTDDPLEEHNLIKSPAYNELKNQLHHRLHKWAEQNGDKLSYESV